MRSVRRVFEDFQEALGDKQEKFVFTLLWNTLIGRPLPLDVEQKENWDSRLLASAMAAVKSERWNRATQDSVRPIVCEVRKKLNALMQGPSGLGLKYRIELPERRFNLAVVP